MRGGTVRFTPFTARIEPGRSANTIALSGELDIGTVPILWALGSGHRSRGKPLASRSPSKHERDEAELPGEIVERMVKETDVAADGALVPAKGATDD